MQLQRVLLGLIWLGQVVIPSANNIVGALDCKLVSVHIKFECIRKLASSYAKQRMFKGGFMDRQHIAGPFCAGSSSRMNSIQ